MGVGPTHWGSFPGEMLEAVMAVLLLQERPSAWRRTPSSGDGGVDVVKPVDDGYHVFQIKGFHDRIGTSERRQIKKSLDSVRTDPRLPGPVLHWSLVVPTDLTSGEEQWLRGVLKDVSFTWDWKPKVFWDSEAAKYPHVVDWYLGNGRAGLERSVQELFNLLEVPGTPVLPAEVVNRISDLRVAVNANDPHYRYEFSTSATTPQMTNEPGLVLTTARESANGCVTIKVFSRYSQAPEDRPIRGRIQVAVSTETHPEAARDLEAHVNYGRAVDLPEGTVTSFSIDAPGGLGVAQAAGGARLGPAEIPQFEPMRVRFQVVDKSGGSLAEATVLLDRATSGQTGIELHGSHVGGAFSIAVQMDRPSDGSRAAAVSWTVHSEEHVGKRAVDVLSGVQLLGHLVAPNELLWRPEFGPRVDARQTLTASDAPAPSGYVRLVEDLAFIQNFTSLPVLIPEEIDDQEAEQLAVAVLLLRGQTVVGSWGPHASMVVATDALDNVLDAMQGPGALALEDELLVDVGGVQYALGRYHVTMHNAVVERTNNEDADSVRIHLIPRGESRSEMRLGPPKPLDALSATQADKPPP